MALQSCLLAFTKDFAKTSTPTTGDDTTVTANVILLIEEAIVSHFNIPVVADLPAGGVTQIAEFTYTRYNGLGDTTGTQVTVPAFERIVSAGNKGAGKVVRLEHGSLKTGKQKPRTVSIRFPSFFTLLMLDQALGTMIKANAPKKWKLDNTGKSYPFIANTSTGVLPGRQSGAWVVATPVTPVGTDTTPVGDTTVVETKSK